MKSPAVTKTFRLGASQAVRIPKAYRFEDGEEVSVRREGNAVIIESLDEWPARFLKTLGAWSGGDLPRLKQSDLLRRPEPLGDDK